MNKPKPAASIIRRGKEVLVPISLIRFGEIRRSEPDDLRYLDEQLQSFEEMKTRNPVDYWSVIRSCVKHKRRFPPSVRAYLGRCADRVLSDEAQQSRDTRKTLLWVLEFPEKGRGPGAPLDRIDERLKAAQKFHFALIFAERLDQLGPRDKLSDARGDAGYQAFGRDVTDRILKKYLREEFQVNKLPSTIEEWEPAIRRYRDDVKAGKRTYWADDR